MLQAPLGFGMFRVIRGMTGLPVPALLNEQVLWLTDLTMADPYMILPIVSSFCLYKTFKVCQSIRPVSIISQLLTMAVTERR
jgi:YidC/Oxa1 family membrane protein insertase